MTGKYRPLYDYLVKRRQEGQTSWCASFEDIETVIGAALPPSARTWPLWWSNLRQSRRASTAWTLAGWKTSNVDLEAATLVFRAGDWWFQVYKSLYIMLL